jgi:hypothetical protein
MNRGLPLDRLCPEVLDERMVALRPLPNVYHLLDDFESAFPDTACRIDFGFRSGVHRVC